MKIISGDTLFIAFWFKEEWDIVPGEYNFKIYFPDDKAVDKILIIDMTFNVHKGNE